MGGRGLLISGLLSRLFHWGHPPPQMPVSGGGSLLLWVTFPKSGLMEGRESAGRGDVSLAVCIMESEQRGGRRSASGCGFQLNFFFFSHNLPPSTGFPGLLVLSPDALWRSVQVSCQDLLGDAYGGGHLGYHLSLKTLLQSTWCL